MKTDDTIFCMKRTGNNYFLLKEDGEHKACSVVVVPVFFCAVKMGQEGRSPLSHLNNESELRFEVFRGTEANVPPVPSE